MPVSDAKNKTNKKSKSKKHLRTNLQRKSLESLGTVCQKQTLPLFTNNQVAAFDHCSGPDLN
jgi:hypothetical protein